jgi:hypothetical protein
MDSDILNLFKPVLNRFKPVLILFYVETGCGPWAAADPSPEAQPEVAAISKVGNAYICIYCIYLA